MTGAILGAAAGMLWMLVRLAGNIALLPDGGQRENEPPSFWELLLPGYIVSAVACIAHGGLGGLLAGLWAGSRISARPPWLTWTVYGATFGAVSFSLSMVVIVLSDLPFLLRTSYVLNELSEVAAFAIAGGCFGLLLMAAHRVPQAPVVGGALAGLAYWVVMVLAGKLLTPSIGQFTVHYEGILVSAAAGIAAAALAPWVVRRQIAGQLQTAEA
jgi:hypothetical protein